MTKWKENVEQINVLRIVRIAAATRAQLHVSF